MYHDILDALIGEALSCQRKADNYEDPFAVAVIKSGNIVGHVPRKNSTLCSLFLRQVVRFPVLLLKTDAIRRIYHKEGLKYPASWFLVEKRIC